VQAGDLAALLAAADESDVGFSVTMPLKEEALRLSGFATEVAVRAGAANTLVRRNDRWFADNTDIAGLVAAIASVAGPGARLASLTVLGSGATARSVALAAVRLNVEHLTVCARRLDAAEVVAELARADGVSVTTVEWSQAGDQLDADVVVSTVVAGVADDLAHAVPEAPTVLLDVVYAPWPSVLAAAWQAQGGVVVPGTRMLLHQAVEQVRLMTGVEGPIHSMRAALESAGVAV
jgi:shikimate dehydrogenase